MIFLTRNNIDLQTIHSFLHIKSTFQNYSTIIENGYFKIYARILTTFRMICLGYHIIIKVEHYKYIYFLYYLIGNSIIFYL